MGFRITLGKKLFAGFALVVLLLALSSSGAVFSLQDASLGFTQYRGLARDTNLAGRVQANLIEARLAVKDFLISRGGSGAERYQQRMQQVNELFALAGKEIQQTERAALIRRATPLLQQYQMTFAEVSTLIEQENTIFYDRLSGLGNAMLATLEQSEAAGNSLDSEKQLTRISSTLLLARLNIIKWFDQHTSADHDRALQLLDQQMPAQIAELQSSAGLNSELQSSLHILDDQRRRYVSAVAELQQLLTGRDNRVSNILDVTGPQIADLLEQVKLSVMQDQEVLGPRLQADNQLALNVLVVISILAVIVAIAAAFWLTRHITGRLLQARNMARTMASGQLNVHSNDRSNDEISELTAALNDMAASLRAMIRDILGASDDIQAYAGNLAAQTERTRSAAGEQQYETDQVATAVNEMAATANEVATSVTQVADASDKAGEQVRNGLGVVDRTQQNIHSLAQSVKDTAHEIEELRTETISIGRILDVIRDIADQTNLLALNAAIEAARAGDQGRGFAVVSDEVRSLAQRTQESTEEIQQLIERLQNGANQAVTSMEKGSSLTGACVELSDEASRALKEINSSVVVMNEMASQIATAAEEQSQVSEQINQSVITVRDISSGSLASADESAASGSQLSALSATLQKLVGRFSLT